MRKYLSFFLVLLVIACTLMSCRYAKKYYPEYGRWYCPELDMVLDFETGEAYFKINGANIKCAHGSDKGSDYLIVGCQEDSNQEFYLGEEVFGARFKSLSETALTVVEAKSGIEYIFYLND